MVFWQGAEIRATSNREREIVISWGMPTPPKFRKGEIDWRDRRPAKRLGAHYNLISAPEQRVTGVMRPATSWPTACRLKLPCHDRRSFMSSRPSTDFRRKSVRRSL